MGLLDKAAQAVEDAGSAAASKGLSVTLDQAVVKDVQAIIAAAKAAIGGSSAESAAPGVATAPGPAKSA
jgi:hypothetical protein